MIPGKRPLKLNLMCANRIKKGYVNMDMQELPGVDAIYYIDPFKPELPFEDNALSEIYWNNGPEHILNTNAMIQEMWRVSVDGAKWYLLTPGYRDRNSWVDPTHFSHWTSDTLKFYTPEGFDDRRYDPAKLTYDLVGDDDHGLEFKVKVIKDGK